MSKIRRSVPDGQVTEALHAAAAGSTAAANDLWSLVYPWLHARARQLWARERHGDCCSPTDLVHEAYGRLHGSRLPRCYDRRHFLGIATRAMREVLVDLARRRQRRIGTENWTSERLQALAAGAPAHADERLDLALAIDELARIDGELARVVELRHYGGLTLPEVAMVVGKSERTLDTAWARARCWLYCRLTATAHP